ncbi:MAG: glycoside hydrolase [Treponema sp.]|nr:glycoside hydrolase [Treponema sp.]
MAYTACQSRPVEFEAEPVFPEDAVEIEIEGAEESGGEPEIPADWENLPVSSLEEIWGYLLVNQEETLKPEYPLSDVVYFGAEVSVYGELTNVPNRKNAPPFSGRMHLAVTCNSQALSHFVLSRESFARKGLIADLIKAAEPYDGLQIDFEYIPKRDGENFRSFLGELKAGLGDKMFTIALPARRNTLAGDVYDYAKIEPLTDRIFVMAYDEHWSTSAPGPIASMDWCRSVAAYALETIGPKKLVMGLPFYGRTWGNVSTNRAFFFSGIERIKREQQITEIRREQGIPAFTYEIPVLVTVYYEDAYSLVNRITLYRDLGVSAVGFWCLGQEDPAFWNLIRLRQES